MKSKSNDSAGSSCSYPQLLVSVRSEQEISTAISGGADIVDLKEPRLGALAPTTIQLWRWASHSANQPDCPPLSAALGESSEALAIAEKLPELFRFAKVGPSGCDHADCLVELWRETQARLQGSIELVPVAYADHHASRCLPPDQVFNLAAANGFRRVLIDTWKKDGRSTVDHLGISGLQRLGQISQDHKLWWALAGSIRLDQAADLVRKSILPNCFAVRGDVCDGDRTGTLCPRRVRRWQDLCNQRKQASPVVIGESE